MKQIPILDSSMAQPRLRARLQPQWLLAAPHRLFFFMGTSLLVFAMALWALDVLSRYLPLLPGTWMLPIAQSAPSLPPGWIHAISLLAGALAAYVFGFVFTALPRWQSRPPVPARAVLPGALLHYTGAILFIAGLAKWGLPLMLAGWIVLARFAIRHILAGPHPDKRHASLVLGFILMGVAGLGAGLIGVWSESAYGLRVALWAILWGMLFPVHLVVSHRMLPFFTANAVADASPWRPYIPLYAILIGAMILGAAVELRWHAVGLVAALTCAGITALFAARWYARGVLSNRLLLMLHVGHAWLPIAFLLAAVQQGFALQGIHVLGLAPLHALTMGFLLSTVVAMVSRVSLGHSGRHVSADRRTWWIFCIVQAGVVLRIATELRVGWFAVGIILTALLVLATLVAWALRYLPIYLQPREDGLPG
ncbi:MAG: NnrS family protein [Betaproteobacteria bacterium]|nr:NnrS family protein [Betaproteobacteria bacterium]